MKEYLEKRIKDLDEEYNEIQEKMFNNTELSDYYYSKLERIQGSIQELKTALKVCKKEVVWSISFKRDNRKEMRVYNNKILAVADYIRILNPGTFVPDNVSELKIYKNGNEYTDKLNEFLNN